MLGVLKVVASHDLMDECVYTRLWVGQVYPVEVVSKIIDKIVEHRCSGWAVRRPGSL